MMSAVSARPSPCLLHTMLRVRDLDRSLGFYCGLLGMRELRRMEFPAQRFSLVYIGYEDDRQAAALELTWNWDQAEPYTHGSGYGHLGIGVADLAGTCARLEAAGTPIPRPPGEMLRSGIHIAFVEDPDGYGIELIEAPFPPAEMGVRTAYD
jgi:lactoylglutathione lyase